MSSPNAPIVKTLTASLQRELDLAKLFEILSKMQTDLQKVYEQVNTGPLPAVDGSKLIGIGGGLIPVLPTDALYPAAYPPDGTVVIDGGSDTLVWYVNGSRYFIAGTSF